MIGLGGIIAAGVLVWAGATGRWTWRAPAGIVALLLPLSLFAYYASWSWRAESGMSVPRGPEIALDIAIQAAAALAIFYAAFALGRLVHRWRTRHTHP